MSMDVLKDDIKNGKIRSLYLFYGPEEYLKKYYMESIEKICIKEDLAALNKVVMEGKVDTRSIVETCETLPVFSDKKLVIVRNSGLFKTKKKSGDEGKKPKPSEDELLNYLQNIPSHVCLVFYEEEVDKRLKIVDAIKSKGLIVEFPYQKPVDLVKWVIKIFKTYKKDIDQMTASRFVENSEQGMTEILNEINKVILYMEGRPKVTGTDIEKVCTRSIKSRIFDLTDAIAERNSIKALKLLDDMVNLKEPLPKILFMITRQFRLVLEMKLLSSQGVNPGEAASRLGVTPYAAGKMIKQAGNFTVDKLKEAMEESLALDLAIKTGRMDDRVAAELLITRFSN